MGAVGPRRRGDWWSACRPCPSRDPPLPVGASLRSAGVQHAAAIAEGEPAGLAVLGEHCWGGGGVKGLPCWGPRLPSLIPLPSGRLCPPHLSRCSPPPPPGNPPDPPGPPGLLLEGATLSAEVSPPPRGSSASGVLTVGGMWVTEVTLIVGAPAVTVALDSGGSVWF